MVQEGQVNSRSPPALLNCSDNPIAFPKVVYAILLAPDRLRHALLPSTKDDPNHRNNHGKQA